MPPAPRPAPHPRTGVRRRHDRFALHITAAEGRITGYRTYEDSHAISEGFGELLAYARPGDTVRISAMNLTAPGELQRELTYDGLRATAA
ncbi:hypothetical protein PV682_42375 [Streptomyces niveiscabiei]|uniref:hypothetical protein n=1 Tax=Streptomyces niveiscabiei TaxID=164115 RepID=UPI0029BC38F8|nr:hypothetical protein [Streptomyces niveiscabiei]MDX3388041.1 hypothetical protein [Streptomyces niveiscabiei]